VRKPMPGLAGYSGDGQVVQQMWRIAVRVVVEYQIDRMTITADQTFRTNIWGSNTAALIAAKSGSAAPRRATRPAT